MDSLQMMPTRVKIASILRKAIYCGEYLPGEELSLTDIAKQLGVSRTPVREAFQSLEAEGLITLRMNKGAIVNSINRKFVSDCFDMRILLEGEAAARAARNGMDTELLHNKLLNLQKNIDTVNKEDYIELNQNLHVAIWKAANNSKLEGYLLELWNGPSTVHSQPAEFEHFRSSTEEHIEIINSIKNNDEVGARHAMIKHISRSRDNILSLYPEEL